jgi:serine/threonine protein kinase
LILDRATAAMSDESLPLDDRYKRVRRLGSGAFGEVWLAEAPGGVEVALKVIFRPVDHEQAQRELQALELIKRLRHPFLLQTHAFWTSGDQLCIAMELADGTLRDRLKACRNAGLTGIPAAELLIYMQEAAAALDFLHKKHVQHGDIKPENILLVGDHAKVADFGLARPHESQRLISADGSGTPLYMAPEVWGGKVSPHSDQYSLAATYAELRRDLPLFRNCTLPELMFRHLEATPDLAPLPEAERAVLLRALAKDPSQRFPNCLEFVRKLEQALAGKTAAVTPPPSIRQVDSDAFRTLSPAVPLSTPAAAPPESGDVGQETRSTAAPTRRAQVVSSGVSRRVLLGMAAGGLVLAAAVAWLVYSWGNAEPAFEMNNPPPVHVHAGEARTIYLQVKRHRYQGAIAVSLADLPPNVALRDAARNPVEQATIPAGAESVEVELIALPDPPQGSFTVTPVATAGDFRSAGELAVQIDRLEYFMPPGWEKAGPNWQEIDGRIYYDRIQLVKDGTRIPFRFIPRDRGRNIASFYIMETKVWAGLYRQFAAGIGPEAPTLSHAWEKVKFNHDNHPAFGVTAVDATRFIQWLTQAGPRGHLPSERQWDKAAGAFEKNRRAGPFEGPPDRVATVNRPKPVEMTPDGADDHDVSCWGVRYMAGNGLEFTDTLWKSNGDKVPFHLEKKPDKDDFLNLRGAGFDRPEPFQFGDLESPDGRRAPGSFSWNMPGSEKGSYIGFRAVFEPAP